MLCAACTDAGLDRSGGSSPRPATVVALAANNDGGSDRDYRNGLAGAPAVARLLDKVAAVSRTSDGYGWRMTKRPAAQVDTVQDVVAGQTDLGWAAVRTFDAVGIQGGALTTTSPVTPAQTPQ